MNCPNCGTENANGSSFCIKCGTKLKDINTTETPIENNFNTIEESNELNNSNVIEQQTQPEVIKVETYEQPTAPVYNVPVNDNQGVAVASKPSNIAFNYLMYIIAFLMKPIKCFKEEENKLSNAKITLIFTLIVAGSMTIINAIKTIFSTVRVKSYSLLGSGSSTTWQWSNIKNIKWLELIGKNFLIYVGVIVGITVIFYLASLVIKKQINFIKTLAITTSSVIPSVLVLMILAPILQLIWIPLSVIVSIAAAMYSIAAFIELINDQIKLEGDIRIYFYAICFTIVLGSIFMIVYSYLSSILGALGGLNNLL